MSVPEGEIALLCVLRNPRVEMAAFLPELESQLNARGIKTLVYDESLPDACSHRMEYAATWRWDLALYLYSADLRVFDRETIVGRAIYVATKISPTKFGSTSAKLSELLNQLFFAYRVTAERTH